MSEQRVRELERRFLESGLPADEEAWLRERLRHGELRTLELAAYLGHPAARAILPAYFAPNGITLDEWVRWRKQPHVDNDGHPPGERPGLAFYGDEALLRSCAALSRGALPIFAQTFPHQDGPAQLLAAFERLILDPTDARRAEVAEAERAMRAFVPPVRQRGSLAPGVLRTWQSARLVVEVCARAAGEHSAADLSLWACSVMLDLVPAERAVDWIRADLVPWALGTGDPLSETRRYSPRGTYRTGQRLRHPTFGEGVVTAVRGTKLVVAFDEGGERQLVHRPS